MAKEVDGHDERRVGPVADCCMIERRTALSDAVTQALTARRHTDALVDIQKLVMLDPCEPRWHQKHGEVLRTLGRNAEAAAAYRRAARRFEALTLHARAGAALRIAGSLDATSSDAVTAPLDRATTARQCQRSQTNDPAPATPRQENFAGRAEEGVAAEAIHEESFAGLLE